MTSTARSYTTERDNLNQLDEIIRKLDAGEYPVPQQRFPKQDRKGKS